ncbi:MAG TPA: serine--tRNA ligase [Polyangiaceae bacterium]|jgi:seryl-tRNA synthetase|nr:serine--tRNA ligase [Polyangiaceae bacterium]
MLDLRYVVDNLDEVRVALARRSERDAALLDPMRELAERRKKAIVAREERAARRNAASKEMAQADKRSPEFTARRDELRNLSSELKELEKEEKEIEAELAQQMALVPNLPDPSVPIGKGEDDNPVVRTWGKPRKQDFDVRPHDDIGVALGILDFERGAKLSGARFTVLRGMGARLERALIGFMLDLHTREHGYTEFLPPFMVKGEALYGTGQLPKFESDLFKTSKTEQDKSFDLYLLPTAEVALVNLHADEILEALPLAYVAYTPCFRSEAGSYGQDVRGMIRQHQFDKVELVRFCRPEHGAEEHETITRHAETVLERLGLHYRRVELCTADLGFGSAKTYDLEVWLPSQKRYREISSCSTCTDFQARRAKIRFRPEPGGKPRLVHTLNGSGLAVGRTLIAILEQCQERDGSITIPEALRAYTGFDRMSLT